jgi:O-acetyl-ADP-ribose deacetylase
MGFYVIPGDITKQNSDAIVNAANASLLGGGGVDGAIHRAAGPGLLEECKGLGGCKTGQAKITGGYNLPARHVIHTPGPIWRGGVQGEDDLLRSCYNACLALAVANNCKSVCFPSISTGVYRFPLPRAASIAIKTILSFLQVHPNLDVTMVCFDETTKKAYEEALVRLKTK